MARPDSVEGRALLAQVLRPAGPFPVFVRFDGQVFTNPTNEEAAAALGARAVGMQRRRSMPVHGTRVVGIVRVDAR